MTVEVRDNDSSEIENTTDCIHDLWVAERTAPVRVQVPTAEESHDLTKDSFIIVTQPNSKSSCRESFWVFRLLGNVKDEAAFAIGETAEPVAETLAVDVGRERGDR
jgi:hypothetical protein